MSNETTTPRPLTADVTAQREIARRSLLRANTAVAGALLAVVVLAGIATVSSIRGRRHQQHAEQAQGTALAELWHAYLSDIRALRRDQTLERRDAALETVRRAAAIAPSIELRNEAAATLALPAFHTELQIPADPALVAYAVDRAIRLCAQSYTNGDLVIRKLPEFQEIRRIRMGEGEIPVDQEVPRLMEFSPDGRRLSVRYRRGALAVWDWEQGRTVFHLDTDKPRRPASRGRFSTDGRIVVSPLFAPEDGTVVVEADTGRRVAFFPEVGSYHHVAVRPGHPMFAAYDGTNVVVLNWETGRREAVFPYAAGVRTMAWSSDGHQLAFGGNLLEVHVWNLETQERRVLLGHKNDVWNVNFDPQGDRLATASYDGTTKLWDLHDGHMIGVTSDGWVTQWGSQDRLIVETPDLSLSVRRLVPSAVYREWAGPVTPSNGKIMDITADGRWAISAAGRSRLQVWDLESDNRPDSLSVEWLRSLSCHPTEPRIILTKRGGPEQFTLAQVTNDNVVGLGLSNPTPLTALANNRLDLVGASADGQSRVWVELGAASVWVEPLEGGGKTVKMQNILHSSVRDNSASVRGSGTISLSADGRWLACGASEATVSIFDAHTGRFLRALSRMEADVQFSPDGRWLVAAGRTVCRVFRVEDWAEVWAMEHVHVESAAAAFSPDGAMLAVTRSPRALGLVDSATGRLLVELQSPDPAPINALRWSADGRRLVGATRDNHIECWEPATLKRELAALNLGWEASVPALAGINVFPVSSQGGAATVWIALGLFITVGPIAVIALLSLRRHHLLIQEFAQAEALAAQRERELRGEREMRELKDSFIAMVSHEFRTPLGIIQSSAQILDRYLDRLPGEQRREQLVSITKNVRRMANLIEEVLVLGKVEGGQQRFQPEPLDLGPFFRKLMDEMHSATHGACPIHLSCPDLPTAKADEALLRHILGNLITNAVKYSPSGLAVEVTVRQEGRSVLIAIKDQGIGIPAFDQASLFNAFQRGGNVGAISGTGLGLTIVKRCVDLHGGSLSFESREGQGTTFRVWLPVFGEGAENDTHKGTT